VVEAHTQSCEGAAAGLGPKSGNQVAGLNFVHASEMAMRGNSRSWLGGADEVVVVMGVHTQITWAGGSGFGADR
jgi:hypothetical protein